MHRDLVVLLHDISNIFVSLRGTWGFLYKNVFARTSRDYLARSAPYERYCRVWNLYVRQHGDTRVPGNMKVFPPRSDTHTGHCRNRIHGIRVVLGRTLNTGFPFLDMRRLWANLYAKLSRAVTHVQKAWTTIKNYIITSSRAKFVCKSVYRRDIVPTNRKHRAYRKTLYLFISVFFQGRPKNSDENNPERDTYLKLISVRAATRQMFYTHWWYVKLHLCTLSSVILYQRFLYPRVLP